jgi:gluconate 2-dehydrogenase gamma chain
MTDRRAFLAVTGSTFASFWLAEPGMIREALGYARQAAAASPPTPWDYLTAEQAADVEAVSAQIIPSEEGPGAREAGVVYFVDRALATWAAHDREPFSTGLDELNREVGIRYPGTRRFAALPPARQSELLRAVEKTEFFTMIREMTIAAFLANPEWGGNRDHAGWRLIGFEDRGAWQPPFGDYDRAAAEGR